MWDRNGPGPRWGFFQHAFVNLLALDVMMVPLFILRLRQLKVFENLVDNLLLLFILRFEFLKSDHIIVYDVIFFTIISILTLFLKRHHISFLIFHHFFFLKENSLRGLLHNWFFLLLNLCVSFSFNLLFREICEWALNRLWFILLNCRQSCLLVIFLNCWPVKGYSADVDTIDLNLLISFVIGAFWCLLVSCSTFRFGFTSVLLFLLHHIALNLFILLGLSLYCFYISLRRSCLYCFYILFIRGSLLLHLLICNRFHFSLLLKGLILDILNRLSLSELLVRCRFRLDLLLCFLFILILNLRLLVDHNLRFLLWLVHPLILARVAQRPHVVFILHYDRFVLHRASLPYGNWVWLLHQQPRSSFFVEELADVNILIDILNLLRDDVLDAEVQSFEFMLVIFRLFS